MVTNTCSTKIKKIYMLSLLGFAALSFTPPATFAMRGEEGTAATPSPAVVRRHIPTADEAKATLVAGLRASQSHSLREAYGHPNESLVPFAHHIGKFLGPYFLANLDHRAKVGPLLKEIKNFKCLSEK